MRNRDSRDKASEADQTITQEHPQWLLESHLSLQRIALYIIAPLSTLVFAVLAYVDQSWQTKVMLASFICTVLTWPIGLRFTRRGKMNASMLVLMISVLAFLTLVMMLVQGTSATSMMAAVIVVIYSSIFSKRLLYFATAASLVSFVASEWIRYFEFYPMKILTPGDRVLFETAFAILLLPLMAVFLRRFRTMNQRLLESKKQSNTELSTIIATANEVGAILDGVVQYIKEVSDAFALQTNEQTEAIKKINNSMSYLKKVANQTVSSAVDTRSVSEKIQEKSVRGSRQLQSIGGNFNKIIEANQVAQVEFAELAETAERIEEVLLANREISAQIKILAVNAGIQAAKAGKYGSGFRVVAGELKGMISRTDESLNHSSKLLEEIRTRARNTSNTVETSSTLLGEQLHELKSTGGLIEEIASTFINTAASVEGIADTAKEQQSRLDDVSTGVSHIDVVAEQLSSATHILVESIDEIVQSNRKLKEVLSSRGTEF
ncbi:MAG: hypothetical protein GY854_32340 [Deltaproteobacteria bacterium]|nr:hypothetical protein [Deltaproteobacteria bacterium]